MVHFARGQRPFLIALFVGKTRRPKQFWTLNPSLVVFNSWIYNGTHLHNLPVNYSLLNL